MARQISFNVTDEDTLDGAMTAYAREWLLLAAAELPEGNRTLMALAENTGADRQRLARWLDALEIRKEFEEL